MNKYLVILAALFLASGIVLADQSLSMKIGENIFRINAGSQGSQSATNRELEQRIWMLERAVNQLQNQVFNLREQVPAREMPRETQKKYSCYLKTSLKGTFTGTGNSRTEAKGRALKECTDGGGGIFCEESELRCDD